jgi:c-di-GMP-binding flagellar brake protein YcgR
MARSYRVDIKTRCTLSYNDKAYPVRLENISADGALVTILSGRLDKMEANGLCNLMLGNSSDPLTSKNSCKVTRFDVDTQRVGVQFLEPLEDNQ